MLMRRLVYSGIGLWMLALVFLGYYVVDRNTHIFHTTTPFLREMQAAGDDLSQQATIVKKYWNNMPPATILTEMDKLPYCHTQGHQVGRMVLRATHNFSEALMLCSTHCGNGCFHGVLLEALQGDDSIIAGTLPTTSKGGAPFLKEVEGHVSMATIMSRAEELCEKLKTLGHTQARCAHGLGHVLTQMHAGSWQGGLTGCSVFTNSITQYHCWTGVFMEYITASDTHANTNLLHPCEELPTWTAACYRYKMRWLVEKQGRQVHWDILPLCQSMTGARRLGCFHGYGYSFSLDLIKEPLRMWKACGGLVGDEAEICVDGALFFVVGMDAVVKKACASLREAAIEGYCLQTAATRLSAAHDYRLYLQ